MSIRNAQIRKSQMERIEKTELLRQSISKVNKNSAVNEVMRKSPRRVYSAVKSKVAQNIRTQNKVTAATRTSWSKIAALEKSEPGKGRVLNQMKSASKTILSPSKVQPKPRLKSSTSYSKTTRYTPSQASSAKKPGNYDNLLQAIRSKYGVDNIEKIPVDQLCRELLPHMDNSEQPKASRFEPKIQMERPASNSKTDAMRLNTQESVEEPANVMFSEPTPNLGSASKTK